MLWKCSIFLKCSNFRPATLLKLNFFTDIFKRYWLYNQLDTLQNSYFKEYPFSEAVLQKCSVKKSILKYFQNFWTKLHLSISNFIKKETLTQVFSCEFGERITYFLQITWKRLLLYFCRTPSSKVASAVHFLNTND